MKSFWKITTYLFVCLGLATNVGAQDEDLFNFDVLIDSADSVAGWRNSGSLSLDTSDLKQGTASLVRQDASKDRFAKTFSPVDASNMRFLTFWYYVDDPSKLGNGDQGQIEISSAGRYDREEMNWSVSKLHLNSGWNYVVLNLPGRHRTVAGQKINLEAVNWFRVYHHPRASIVTKIDHIRFTRHLPPSLAFDDYAISKQESELELEQIDVSGLRALGDLPFPGVRAETCRELRIEMLIASGSLSALEKLGATEALAKTQEYLYAKNQINDFVCVAAVHSVVQQQGIIKRMASANVARIDALAKFLKVPVATSADVLSRIHDLDTTRIYENCGTLPSEIAHYIETGEEPSDMTGPNVLFRDCSIDSGASGFSFIVGGTSVTGELGLERLQGSPGEVFRRCMEGFQKQASECQNPYMDAKDEYRQWAKRNPYKDESNVERTLEMAQSLQEITSFGRYRNVYGDLQSYDTTQTNDQANWVRSEETRQELEALHKEFDDEKARYTGHMSAIHEWNENQRSDKRMRDFRTRHEGEDYRGFYDANYEENNWRIKIYQEQADEHREKFLQKRDEICKIDPTDEVCNHLYSSPPRPFGSENQRCSSLAVGDSSAWYNKDAGESGFARQLNEGDNINHCLCGMAEKNYAALGELSPFTPVASSWSSFCPSAEERVKHECMQMGWDDGPVAPACLDQLVSDDFDASALKAELCWAMRSGTCPNPEIGANGDCSCFDQPQSTGSVAPTASCQNVIRCGEGEEPQFINNMQTCGCQSTRPQKDVCLSDIVGLDKPQISYFPDLFGEQPTLSVPTNTPFASRPLTRQELSNNQLNLGVYNTFSSNASGQLEARCTNPAKGVSNFLIDRVQLDVSADTTRDATINFRENDLRTCFDSEAGSTASRIELSLKTRDTLPRFNLLTQDMGIWGPVFPDEPCDEPGVPPYTPTVWNFSNGDVLRPGILEAPLMHFDNGIFTAPSNIITEPVFFEQKYSPSLGIVDSSREPTVSVLDVYRVGQVSGLTFHVRLKGDERVGRYRLMLYAPNGTLVYDVFNLAAEAEGEVPESEFDGGFIVDPGVASLDSVGQWRLEVWDEEGNNDGEINGELFSWSLNFNSAGQ